MTVGVTAGEPEATLHVKNKITSMFKLFSGGAVSSKSPCQVPVGCMMNTIMSMFSC